MATKKKKQQSNPIREKILNGPKIRAQFNNIEDPGMTLEFTKEGLHFKFEHGKEYDMPVAIMTYLNSLCVPDDKYELVDDGLGHKQLKGISRGVRHRFSCIPNDETMSRITTQLATEGAQQEEGQSKAAEA